MYTRDIIGGVLVASLCGCASEGGPEQDSSSEGIETQTSGTTEAEVEVGTEGSTSSSGASASATTASADASSTSSETSSASSGPTGSSSSSSSSGEGESTTTAAELEVCDGIDNDGNGFVDDVDVGDDGVCDCLRIATLGEAGPWGEGDVFATWLEERSDDGAHPLGAQELTDELLGAYQIIVVQDVSVIGRSYAESEVEALQNFIDAGGGVMTMIGYAGPTEIENVNLLLGPWGLSYGPTQILGGSGGATLPVTQWMAHPISAGITSVGVDNGYPVQGAGTVFAQQGGWDVGRALDTGSGHIAMWGDEWISYDSEWTDHPEYQVEQFWLNAIHWLTPVEDCQIPLPG